VTRKRKIWIAVGAVVVVAGAAAALLAARREKGVEVQIAKVGREDLQAKVTANGKVQAKKKVDLSATVPGQITELSVQEGDAVAKGQFLLQIDPVAQRTTAQATAQAHAALEREVQSARAQLEQARADHRRAQENQRAQILALADLERAATAVKTAEAALAAAERRVAQLGADLEGARDSLSKTTVRSPIDGIVTAKRVEEGEVAVIGVLNNPGTVLLTISDMSVVEAELEVDETSIPSVELGQQARVRVDAYPNKTFHGVVTEVGSSPIQPAQGAQQEAIKFRVKVELQDPPAGIKPGLSVQADILTGFRPQAVAVPIQALVVRDAERPQGEAASAPAEEAPREQEGVYLWEDGKARFRPIRTGLMGELSVEVVEGLAGGETLITGPFRSLRTLKPGDAVRQEKEKKEGAGRPETGEEGD
jgi:HlyD family secretion protein